MPPARRRTSGAKQAQRVPEPYPLILDKRNIGSWKVAAWGASCEYFSFGFLTQPDECISSIADTDEIGPSARGRLRVRGVGYLGPSSHQGQVGRTDESALLVRDTQPQHVAPGGQLQFNMLLACRRLKRRSATDGPGKGCAACLCARLPQPDGQKATRRVEHSTINGIQVFTRIIPCSFAHIV